MKTQVKVQIYDELLNSLFNSMFLFFIFSYSNPLQWTATFGVSTIRPILRVRVRTIVSHNNYRPTTRDNDIAVVQLERPITFNRNIHRVCLPAATQSIIPGSVAYVTGWGSLTYGGKYLWKINSLTVNLLFITMEICFWVLTQGLFLIQDGLEFIM